MAALSLTNAALICTGLNKTSISKCGLNTFRVPSTSCEDQNYLNNESINNEFEHCVTVCYYCKSSYLLKLLVECRWTCKFKCLLV